MPCSATHTEGESSVLKKCGNDIILTDVCVQCTRLDTKWQYHCFQTYMQMCQQHRLIHSAVKTDCAALQNC